MKSIQYKNEPASKASQQQQQQQILETASETKMKICFFFLNININQNLCWTSGIMPHLNVYTDRISYMPYENSSSADERKKNK